MIACVQAMAMAGLGTPSLALNLDGKVLHVFFASSLSPQNTVLRRF